MFPRLLVIAVAAALALGAAVHGSSGAGRPQLYVVKPTDTLWSIAAKHYRGDPREGVWKLEQRNGVDAAALRVGQRLVLP
jgi:LysM repeat protein